MGDRDLSDNRIQEPVLRRSARQPMNGQELLDLGGPVGFIEGHYRHQRGSLFFAASFTSGGLIRHLVRDVPDRFTHHGWSPTAEYRRDGRWIPIADALETDAPDFSMHPSDWANLRGRWRLTNYQGAGDSVAAELCGAAVDWWDKHSGFREPLETEPEMKDFCAVFPRLWARREPDDPEWILCYLTDSARWTRRHKEDWRFGGRITPRLRTQLRTCGENSAPLWRDYAEARRLAASVSEFSQSELLHEDEAIAAILAASADFQVLLPLLPLILAEERWAFAELARYTTVNAEVGAYPAQGTAHPSLTVENGLSQWAYRGGHWQERAPGDSGGDYVRLDNEYLLEASLRIERGESNISERWTEEFYSPGVSIVTDTEAAGSRLDFPIFDVVRGNVNSTNAGWSRRMDGVLGWNWEIVDQLSVEHHMPDWPWEEGGASTTAVEVSTRLAPLLEEFFDQDTLQGNDIWNPMWSGFLSWVRDRA